MLESLHTHCPGAIVHVLCLSEECHAALTTLNYPFVRLLRLAELETADPELLAVRPTRSLVEYYFTLTPCLPWYLLHNVREIDAITYLDADMMFFSSPEPIFAEAGDASVILTPHRFPPQRIQAERYGIYNVSWLTFSTKQQGLACLEWYRSACLDWCYDRLEADRFADQKYLDAFPALFADVHVIQHKGAGLAPWNIDCVEITNNNGTVCAGEHPIIFYHAQEFTHLLWRFFSAGVEAYHISLAHPARKYLFAPYLTQFISAAAKNPKGISPVEHNGIRNLNTKKASKYALLKRVGRAVLCRSLLFA